MNQDPFGDPFKAGSGFTPASGIFSPRRRFIGGHRPKKPEAAAGPDAASATGPGEELVDDRSPAEEEQPKATLRNPKWEAETVGFNEETPVSVEVILPEAHRNKKKVLFELYAVTPEDPERISQAEGFEENGKATAKIPVYQPNYLDEGGNLLHKVEYYFTAKHSQSDLLKDETAKKTVDGKADRVIESHVMEDTTFDTDSSFLHPRNAPQLKALGERIQAWREKHPEATLAIFGHTDAVGQEVHNKGLSERRAKSLHAFLVKDAAVPEALYQEEAWGLEAVQTLLGHLGHDPGAIDGIDGQKTQGAVKAFQGKQGLAVDGKAGPKTREALFKAFAEGLHGLKLDKKHFEDIAGNPFTGCSEFNLLEETQGALEKNRRVTVLLLKSTKKFPLNYPCKPGSVEACKAQVKKAAGKRRKPSFTCCFYDELVKEEGGGGGGGKKKLDLPDYDPNPGKVEASGPVGCATEEPVDPIFTQSLLMVSPAKAEHTQYVNLASDGKALGRELKVEVQADGAKDGQKVFWLVTPGKENSARNDPKPGVKTQASASPVAFDGKAVEVETEVKGGRSSLILDCGHAGGDVYDVVAGLEKNLSQAGTRITTSRKIWYQYTHDENMKVPRATASETAFAKVGIESAQAASATFKKADAPARTYYPEFIIEPGGADKEVAVIGSHNKAAFQKLLKADPAEPVKAHLILCEHQWDEGDETEKVAVTMKKPLVENLAVSEAIFNPALSGPLVLSGDWESKAPAGHPDHGKKGKITDDWIVVGKTRPNRRNVSLKAPAGTATPSDEAPVKVSFSLRGVDGPFLGESGKPHMLVVFDASDVRDFNNTVTHEIGHALNQTPDPGKQSPGLPKHPRQYRDHGGIGPHCHTDKNAKGEFVDGTVVEVPDPDDPKKKVKEFATGVCVMFHQGDSRCIDEFCPVCVPYVKATDVSAFGKA